MYFVVVVAAVVGKNERRSIPISSSRVPIRSRAVSVLFRVCASRRRQPSAIRWNGSSSRGTWYTAYLLSDPNISVLFSQ